MIVVNSNWNAHDMDSCDITGASSIGLANMRFGERLRLAREAAGYGQRELGEACKWDAAQPRISNYESGAREPTLADIERMASVLGVPASSLAFGQAGLSDDELAILQAWRLSDTAHKDVLWQLASVASRAQRSKRTLKLA